MVVYKWRASSGLQTVTDQDNGSCDEESADLSALAEMMAFGGNRPRSGDLRKIGQQLLCPGQRADLGHLARIGFCVNPLKLSRFRSGNSAPVSRRKLFASRPPLIPIRRWIRHTASSMPACSKTPRQARTYYFFLSAPLDLFSRSRLSDRRILLGCIIRPPDDEELERNPKE